MHLSIRTILWGLLMLMLGRVDAQSRTISLNSKDVDVTFNKTSSIIFPAAIKSVDRGSRDVLAQKAKGVDNVLQLKAARINFPETNLTVITADGKIHQFNILYSKQPERLIQTLSDSSFDQATPIIFQTHMAELEMETYARLISSFNRSIVFLNKKKYKMNLALHGVYVRNNMMFFHFQVRNLSSINYDIDFIRLYVQDKNKVKRTASQEVDVIPVFAFGNTKTVEGVSESDIVYAVDKFTIPDAKRFVIEMFERNGGRDLNLAINNKTIVNALPLD